MKSRIFLKHRSWVIYQSIELYWKLNNMGAKCSSSNLTFSTPFFQCSGGKCSSACTEKNEEPEDPQLKQIQIAIRVEMAILEKMILDKMIAHLKTDGEIPQLNIIPTGMKSPETPRRTLNIRI
jgi:hypothetical protein